MYYKALTADGCGPYSGVKWFLPTRLPDGTYKPGKWMPRIEAPLVCCRVGYHGCERGQVVRWLSDTLYELQYDGEPARDSEKCWGRRARLLRPFLEWDARAARLFSCDCAERVLPHYESYFPGDDRPRRSIEMSRKFANGEVTSEEMAGAARAARAAAREAAVAAGAARAAARAAAWATGAAEAAWAAAGAAGAAAGAAARAARAAAWAAAEADWAGAAAEADWQTGRLFVYLEG